MDEAFFSKGKVRMMSSDYLILARISAVQNKNEKAITYLEAVIDNGYVVDWRTYIAQSPIFLRLHQHPKYIALIKRYEAEMVRQRAILEQDLATE